ncbi:2-isopropylmalate synthase [Aerococcus urinaehominis]|uniref:2-isopropylmalate synthase n=1 Tax=Aerococcus urinaehominis TaxID=128944 RepID=A0A0X8FKK4_9LACT|nr:2-isopropylmalate synthase [Aerococcus urinaehominis]AMB98779.1 2-isopropylmalate synthase [Aerococcus urinaehominis]SDM12967.1 2-isopropylmalate synthase [Aerococcus urinaehominis]
MTRKIQILDTTLRDGEQTPGVNFNTADKLEIAKQLERWGVDAIEAGFPITSPGDFEAVKAIADTLKQTQVVGLARCVKKDIDAVRDALVNAVNPQIHVFLATSPIHRQYKLQMSKEEVLASIKEHVSYAKQYFDQVQFSPEDATRTEWDFLVEAINVAIDAGATMINVPDTTGYTNPSEFGRLFAYLKENCPKFDQAIFACHCHNDLGMATANSIAALENGASRVEGSVNGIGERAGNVALEEVATALYIRRDYYDMETNINLSQTKITSDLVSHLSGMFIPRNKPIIGDNAFAHESGIHQDGVLKHAETYEIITPSLVGVEKNSLPLGKLSGRHAFDERLKELGYELAKDELNEAFTKFKVLADKKKQVTNEDLVSLVLGRRDIRQSAYRLNTLQLMTATHGIPTAVVEICRNEEEAPIQQATSIGEGPVEAIFNAIDSLMPVKAKLMEYRLDAVTEGIDAQATVYTSIADDQGNHYNGTGVDYDVITASAYAYLQAYGKFEAGRKGAQ